MKDGLISSYSDAVWVDNIVLPPHNVVISSTDEKTLDSESLHIYPIPAQNLVTIEFDSNLNASNALRILNSKGQTVLNKPNLESSHTVQLDISNYPAGIYLVQLLTKEKLVSKKLVIQH